MNKCIYVDYYQFETKEKSLQMKREINSLIKYVKLSKVNE